MDGPNPYLYVAGDPVQFIDPWGLCISAPPERNWFERLYFGTRNDYYTYRDFPMLRHKVAEKYEGIAAEFILWSEFGGPIIGRGARWVSRPITRTVGKWGVYRATRLRWLRFGRGARRFRFWRWGKTRAAKSGYPPGDLMPGGRIAGEGPGTALRGSVTPPQKPVLLGRFMETRVKPVARAKGFDWYKAKPRAGATKAQMLLNNERWIRGQIKSGRGV